jgi:methylamine dehydrogenase accessory protein MauD
MEKIWLISYGAAWIACLSLGFCLVTMMWALGRILWKTTYLNRPLITDEGPELHTAMPVIQGRDMEGGAVHTDEYRSGELMLLFVSPGCGPCDHVMRTLRRVRREVPRCPQILVVLEAEREDAERTLRRSGMRERVILDESGNIRKGLGVERTPYGFLLDEQGVVRMKGVINDQGQLEGLIRRNGRHIGKLSWSPS